MPTRSYTRKSAPAGGLADPSKGSPSFFEGAKAALPGRTWRSQAGSGVTLAIDGAELTTQEDGDLTAAHTAWVPTDQESYFATYEVTTEAKGLVTKTEWFETDNGDGTYSGLAQDAVNLWAGKKKNSVLISTTTTQYAKDGTVLGSPVVVSFYTTDGGKRVKKVT